MLVLQSSPRIALKAFLSIWLSLPIITDCVVHPYVYPREAVPNDTLRIIALGTGVPSIFKSQAATSYQLGSTERNIVFDVGTGSIANLYATRVNLSTIDKVSHVSSLDVIAYLCDVSQASARNGINSPASTDLGEKSGTMLILCHPGIHQSCSQVRHSSIL